MSDLIDRQAAIDALDEIESEVADGYGYQYEKWRKYFCELPSAQPEPCEDVVSRKVIMRHYDSGEYKHVNHISRNGLLDYIEQLPSAQPDLSGYSDRLWKAAYERGKAEAQPDIIHCGECKYYDDSDGCFFSTATTGADGFCHWAERKEGEADG